MLVSMRKLPTIPQDFADQLKLVSRGLEESRDFRMKHGEAMIIDYVGMLNHGAGPSSYRPDSMHPCGYATLWWLLVETTLLDPNRKAYYNRYHRGAQVT